MVRTNRTSSPHKKFILTHNRAPGDTLVLTTFVRDLKLAHPEIDIDVSTSAMDLWRHNPYLTPLRQRKSKKDIQTLKMEYGKGIREQNYETIHFAAYFHRFFERKLNIPVPMTLPYPDLHLSDDERNVRPVAERYWVVLSGGKTDFPIKVWETAKFQQVVDGLRGMGLQVVQAGGNDRNHWHPELRGVIDLVGKTNLRDLMRLIHHADGVVCGVSCPMHMAAALHRPCVVIAGGREAWWWEAYVPQNEGLGGRDVAAKLLVPHKFLHTIGLLECCKWRGCWKNKVVAQGGDKLLCKMPVIKPGQPLAMCMEMITSQHVLEAVMEYYTDKSLPPIDVGQPMAPPPMPPKPPRKLLDLFGDNKDVTPPNGKVRKAAPPAPQPVPIVPKMAVQLEGRGDGRSTAVARRPGGAPEIGSQVFDHPSVGGKFTIFVLFYGPEQYFDLHRRCLESIITTVSPEHMDLRIGSNELNAKSVDMIENFVKQGVITKHYLHKKNAYKYPVMREMFHDPNLPITTKWVLWFDDDTVCDRTASWLNILAQSIIQSHKQGNAHMFGARRTWTLLQGQKEWCEAGSWFRDRPWRQKNGTPSPNGNKCLFATGGFWAITDEAIKACDIPDPRLTHNGGDYVIGEQLYQGGYGLKMWNANKQFVHTSSVDRRGTTTAMPGTTKIIKPKPKNPVPKLVQVT